MNGVVVATFDPEKIGIIEDEATGTVVMTIVSSQG